MHQTDPKKVNLMKIVGSDVTSYMFLEYPNISYMLNKITLESSTVSLVKSLISTRRSRTLKYQNLLKGQHFSRIFSQRVSYPTERAISNYNHWEENKITVQVMSNLFPCSLPSLRSKRIEALKHNPRKPPKTIISC